MGQNELAGFDPIGQLEYYKSFKKSKYYRFCYYIGWNNVRFIHSFFCIFLFCCVLDFHKSFFYRKGIDTPVPRFDKNFEEFFSLCDQMELHLVSWSFSSVFLKYRVLYMQIYVARSIINSVKMPPLMYIAV